MVSAYVNYLFPHKFYFSRLQGYTKQSHSKIAISLRVLNTEVLEDPRILQK